MRTDHEHATPGDVLWHFCVHLYGADGVSQACVALQDDSGVDVPVLLFGAWLGREGIALDMVAVDLIRKETRDWHEQVVQADPPGTETVEVGPPACLKLAPSRGA